MSTNKENRTSRDLEERDTEKRTKHWSVPDLLPTPKPQAGWEFRYIRVSALGEVDAANVSSKLREGWTPCKASDHPEIVMVAIEQQAFKENIVIGGLMLCKAPVEMVKERNDHYRQQAENQIQSVDNNLMRESDPRMPMFNESKQRVSFGSKR